MPPFAIALEKSIPPRIAWPPSTTKFNTQERIIVFFPVRPWIFFPRGLLAFFPMYRDVVVFLSRANPLGKKSYV